MLRTLTSVLSQRESKKAPGSDSHNWAIHTRMKFPLIILLAALAWMTALPPGRSNDANDCAAPEASIAGPPTFPSYERALVLDQKAETSANVSIGDLNGDGNLDILLVNGRHWPKISRIFLGDGHGHIVTAYNLTETAYRSYSGRLVDMDGDGDLDVVL